MGQFDSVYLEVAGLGKDSQVPHTSDASFEIVSEEMPAELTPLSGCSLTFTSLPSAAVSSVPAPRSFQRAPCAGNSGRQKKRFTVGFILSLRRICLCPVPVPVTIFGKRVFANIIKKGGLSPRTIIFRDTGKRDKSMHIANEKESRDGMT